MTVKTRIAPSPTGDPHVGTAYQALFNYVFAHQNGGSFIVRIEDTDRARYQEASERRILEMINWIGLEPDESPLKGGPSAPYVQSERTALHQKYASELLARGAAYRSFETPEELEAMRAANRAAGKQEAGYDRRYRTLSQEESDARAERGDPFVIRLKVPEDGETVVRDRLRGDVSFRNADLDDKVLLKSDGFPTYHLAAMVDDHLMGVTHVIRAEEWLVSTPLHALILRGLGWEEPEWIHTPLLRNPDHSKLSKRKMDTSVDSYRAQGILPEALLNYLGTMGWSMPDGREVFSVQDMIENFTWDRVSLGGPVFDLERLTWMNGKYIRELLPLDELVERCVPFLQWAGVDVTDRAYVTEVVKTLRERFKLLSELPEAARYFFEEPVPDAKAAAKLTEGRALLKPVLDALRDEPDWSHEALEPKLRDLAAGAGVKFGALMQPLRAALTGRLESPGLFEVMATLGRERVLARVERAVGSP
ncbi:MAG TPA: glutamate--tRNA ligase [Deinococcales bacterium]|nr:glutamate--tRNA ligase [Deinococcales bacterium]